MVTGLHTAASAMGAQTERLAVLANNLANAGAAGFKADHLEFFQLLTSPRAAGSVSPTDPAAPPSPTTTLRNRTDFSAGPLRETGNPLDVAIEGPGFFVVDSANGLRLTRAGTFARTSGGVLATIDGTPVLDARRQPVPLPEGGRIEIADDGTVLVDGAQVGQLLIVNPDIRTLSREDGTRFVPPADASLAPFSQAQVRQGALELANVNPILTLVEMIDALRVYEAAQRAARGVDETLGRAVNDVSRT